MAWRTMILLLVWCLDFISIWKTPHTLTIEKGIVQASSGELTFLEACNSVDLTVEVLMGLYAQFQFVTCPVENLDLGDA